MEIHIILRGRGLEVMDDFVNTHVPSHGVKQLGEPELLQEEAEERDGCMWRVEGEQPRRAFAPSA